MKNIHGMIKDIQLDTHLSLEEIPDLDLYMDQVIQLFERKFAGTKRNEEEKVLTKTMINNYAKGKLFFPIQNKRYTKDHVILISMIYQMKGSLSIQDVKQTLGQLNEKVVDESISVKELYKKYIHLLEANHAIFEETVGKHTEQTTEAVEELEDKASDYLEQLLLIASFTMMSNFYRKAAEKLVDHMQEIESQNEEGRVEE
ncbi:DUF1836 domain-containing protein [Virgibacillus sp. YIM 98842]|uniref:DUF1836 domain-containing protein n=1 Tax=Virgibacillus sp. YIM 98842 TaxID=2663533 RepID=UPI0013D8FDBC|nr:DUF1836 domain-containing protein [Virgibacillus sp. YIM 98842]